MSDEEILAQILRDEQLEQFFVRLRDELQVSHPIVSISYCFMIHDTFDVIHGVGCRILYYIVLNRNYDTSFVYPMK